MNYKRYRFRTAEEDFRPVIFPPPGPYWCTGYTSENAAILVAYLPPGADLLRFWPEAEEVELTEEREIIFTSRFPKPDWFNEDLVNSSGVREGAGA